jgi:hypothetical protein
MSNREVTRPRLSQWRQVVLDPEPGWVQYQGLWGVKSTLHDESGPPGPKWDRPDKLFQIAPRKRWDRELDWLMELENSLTPGRKKKKVVGAAKQNARER